MGEIPFVPFSRAGLALSSKSMKMVKMLSLGHDKK
jgi:hypothetical protein